MRRDRDCNDCQFCRRDVLFDLCVNDASRYNVAGVWDHHTIGHMRTRGPCGENGSYFIPIAVRRSA